jgi:CheY-like chemotaxis protein
MIRNDPEARPSTPDPAMSSANPNLRVLLVDDQDDLLMMMNLMFRRRGAYAVETANSGAQAMQKASDFAPHVVVSDIGMPDMDGCELMERLRRLEGEQLSPFKSIALSGYDAGHDTRIRTAGYDAQLTKPVDFDVLFGTIDQLAGDMQDSVCD